MPELYNQHYINKYSFPKGLTASRKPQTEKRPKQSIYDVLAQPVRKGVSGWKLTKRVEPVVERNPALRMTQNRRESSFKGGSSTDTHGRSTIHDANSPNRPNLYQTVDSNLNASSRGES